MTGSMDDRDKFLAAIEQLGEETVRARIKAKYWTAQHRAWADLWIKDIESRRHAEEQEVATEARALTRSMAEASGIQAAEASEANRIAREASDKAHTANTIAIVAVIIAIITVAVMIVSAFVE